MKKFLGYFCGSIFEALTIVFFVLIISLLFSALYDFWAGYWSFKGGF